MANKYPNPCEKCGQKENCTNYRVCEAYLKYFRTIWKQFNGYPVRAYRAEQKKEHPKFRYEHPAIVLRYLEKGPCEKCKRAQVCETPCAAYWHWWDARMEWMRRRFGV